MGDKPTCQIVLKLNHAGQSYGDTSPTYFTDSYANSNSGQTFNPFYTERTLLLYILAESIFNLRGVRLC